MIPKINWIKIDINDFKFQFEEYLLRVEKMQNGIWWFMVYFNHKQITNRCQASSKHEAMMNCQIAFISHLLKK